MEATATKEAVFIIRGNGSRKEREVTNPYILIGARGNLIAIGTYAEVQVCFADKVKKLRGLGLLDDIDEMSFVEAPHCQKEIDKILTSPLYASRFRDSRVSHLYWK